MSPRLGKSPSSLCFCLLIADVAFLPLSSVVKVAQRSAEESMMIDSVRRMNSLVKRINAEYASLVKGAVSNRNVDGKTAAANFMKGTKRLHSLLRSAGEETYHMKAVAERNRWTTTTNWG